MAETTRPRPSAGTGSAIQVVVRLRPMNETEQRHGTLPVVTAKTAEKSVSIIKGKGKKQLKSSYTFDNVFTAFSTQEEVFEATVKPVIVDVMRGFEATVFAYGQTGTGKTHTMEGSLNTPDLYGVIPRSAQAIFEHLKQPRYREERVTCSCLEIYNEELRDLLVDNNSGGSSNNGGHNKLDIMEGKTGTFCRGLTEVQVQSASGVLSLMNKSQHSRMIGETKMNKSSSRSHCLFTIQVHGKVALLDGDGDMEFNGKLHMVDLAGSECAKSAINDKGAPDAVARERERMNINRSLLTLGRVITVLKEKSLGKNGNARIPYRDSKLTRVLQEALGGRCKTVIVATLSPSITAVEETLSTLNYAHSANGIFNKPVSSSLIAFGENMPSMADSDSKSPATIESWQEMEMRLGYMQAQVDEAQAALARKHLQQQELQERADKAEAELLASQQKLYDAKKEIKGLKGVVETETRKRKQTETELGETQVNLKKTQMVLRATQATESSLTAEAQELISKLEEIISDRNDLHALVVNQRGTESERRKAAKQFQEAALIVLNNIESSFTHLCNNIEASQSNAIKIATMNHEVGRQSVSETQKLVTDIAKNVSCVSDSIKTQMTGEGGIVPTVESGSSTVLGVLQSANDEFNKGENLFNESREAMRTRLNDCTKTLDDQASSIQASTNQALQSFEAKVVESKNQISHLVMRMKGSLLNLSEAKATQANALDSLVGQWRDQSTANSKDVLEAATSSCTSLKASVDEFELGLHNHEEMKNSLENQHTFLNNTGSSHVKSIGQQGSLLNAHRQNMAEAHETQCQLRTKVMQSILSGVHAIVSSEIQKLAASDDNQFQLLDKDGFDLVNANKSITQSANQVMDNIQSTNEFVSNRASVVCTNDLKASEALKSTRTTLEQVMTSASAHNDLTTDFASKSISAVSEMKQIDGQNAAIIKSAERDGKAASASLVNSVFKPTRAEMKKTLKTSLDVIAYVNGNVVPSVNGDLANVAASRKMVAKQMAEQFESAGSQLTQTSKLVATSAKAQHGIADKLGSEIVAVRNAHTNKSVPYYYAELDSGKDKLVSTMHSLSDTSTRAILEGKVQGSIVKESLEEFAHNKMQCNKPVDPVPSKKECNFNQNLSSTPAEDEIVKGADFGVPLHDDSTKVAPVYASKPSPSATTTCAAPSSRSESPIHPDLDSSHDSQDDDSRKSSGSFSSLPSPRLKYRDINVNHVDNNNNPKRMHHQNTSTSASRKNRCPSGIPSGMAASSKQSRKRMKR